VEKERGQYFIWYAEGKGYGVSEDTYRVDLKLRDMDRAGVDAQVLSLILPGADLVEPELGRDLAATYNDAVAELEKEHPSRFYGLAALPAQDTDLALKELERAVGTLGLRGVCLFSNVAGKHLDTEELWPLYARTEGLGIPLFLHPTLPVVSDRLPGYGFEFIIGYLFDTTIATLALIFSGVLERHPNLQVVVPHAGSTIPYILGRVDYESQNPWARSDKISKPASHYFRKLYVDTVCDSTETLQMALDCVGEDRVLFASDYPYWNLERSVALIENLPVEAETKRKIFGENARRLLKLDR
jgi:predicted TIM-barrel fold metal-dependent hydrolase